ncbi:TRAP transporter large permease [Sinisalibacter aestuarii]|uniref:TRAP transporter large permease protein n=1 Tax=Sinisalibacter aestuarii TaxID=2949426 RepID=A0ABQ5LRL9_9RHOB|nr:TRAP transporter large permease [Sinisalibacter aestuarii]GKY87040.1 membrane protein [Sinisalibacter aestuarii]
MSIVLVLIVFFGMILLGVPVAFSMLAISALYFATGPIPSFVELLPQKVFEGIDYIVLTAIPFFLLAGEIMNRSGMAERLMHFANLIVGRVRGGFAYVNVLASLLFSGLTGVAVGDIAALGKLEVEAMEKSGYPRAFAAAVTVSSSLVGPIIPPSGVIILYCAIMNTSVGGMFLAALIPGVLMAVADMLIIGVEARKRNFPVANVSRTWPDFVLSTKDATLALLMPVLLIGGIVGGIMTPTEAAAAAVVYALFVGTVIYRALSLRQLARIFISSGFDAARLLFMIGSALAMTWIFALENVSGLASDFFSTLDVSPIVLVICINILFLVLGMFMDAALALILFAPVIAPVAYAAGMGDLQFGIMVIVNVTIGLATPPIGNVLFAMCSVVSLKTSDLVRELLPFLALKFILLVLVGTVPALTTFIPSLLGFN